MTQQKISWCIKILTSNMPHVSSSFFTSFEFVWLQCNNVARISDHNTLSKSCVVHERQKRDLSITCKRDWNKLNHSFAILLSSWNETLRVPSTEDLLIFNAVIVESITKAEMFLLEEFGWFKSSLLYIHFNILILKQ